ncbi:hypothetical protein P7C70_g7762, partial [Phenoliferia sp. Uapishka_3]
MDTQPLLPQSQNPTRCSGSGSEERHSEDKKQHSGSTSSQPLERGSDDRIVSRFGVPTGRLLLGCLALVLLITILRPLAWEKFTHAKTPQCLDPYLQPGYIQRTDGTNQTSWHPYTNHNLLKSSSLSVSKPLEPPIPYSDLLLPPTRASDARLNFARGQSILMVGESLDRDNAKSFCDQHGNAETVDEMDPFISFACRLPDLDLNITQWFTYGMRPANSSWYQPGFPGPLAFEDRWEERFLPLLPLYGTPSLVVVASHYWDLRFIQEQWTRDHPGMIYHVSPEDLLWHRERVVELMALVRSTFPDAKIMWRLGTKWQDEAHAFFGDGNLGVYRINESMRALMKHLNVPLFNWATLLEGEKDAYRDGLHFKDGQPGSLFASMIMYYLKKAVSGETTCS